MAGRLGFRWRQVAHDLGSGLLFRVIRQDGAVLVVAPQPSFTALVDLTFNQVRQYGRGDLAVSIRLVHAIGRALRACQDEAGRARLLHHAALVRAGLSEQFLPADRSRFDETFAAALPGAGAPEAS